MQTEAIAWSKRTCRWCGATYRVPVGSRDAGCETCAPRLFDVDQVDVADDNVEWDAWFESLPAGIG